MTLTPTSIPFNDHVEAVDTLAAVGIAPPKAWTDLRQRFADYRSMAAAAGDRLAQAVIDGDTAELAMRRALALAEAGSDGMVRATVDNHVQTAVLSKLTAIYAPTVAKNYGKVADLFDAAATKFAAAASVVDPETDAESIISADEPTRAAWATAPLAVRDIEAVISVLREAAWLAGVADTRTAETTIALTVEPGEIKRRAVWAAWEDDGGRCGRWSALHRLGVTVRARRDLADLEPYRRPLPMQEKTVAIRRGRWEKVLVDPEEEQVAV